MDVSGVEAGTAVAWESASRAGWHFMKFRRDDNAAARSLWERASELDPLWVWPHQAVATTHLVDLGRLWTSRPDESVAAIVQAAERAVALDEQDPWAQLALGIASWVTGQLHEQIAAFQRAARLGPNITSAHLFLGMALTQANRPEEALTSLGRVVTLSPRDFQVPLVRSWEGLAHFAAGRYDEAIGALRLSIDLDPQHPQPYHALAASLAELGRIDEAQSALRDAHRLRPGFSLAKAEQTWPILGPHIREHYLAVLRKAGLE